MELIDVLVQNQDNAPLFTVDTGEISTPITNAETNYLGARIGGYQQFRRGDNFILLSMGISLPFNFNLGQLPGAIHGVNVKLYYETPAGGGNLLPLATESEIFLPFENYELSINHFVDVSAIPDRFRLSAVVFDSVPYVSMIGCPAALDEMVVLCPIFIKILHNHALAAWEV